ncbi:hypothetical protein QBC38DRAFT_87458 [Podospora fimiseda]|uniref:Uncharacterized protein n=1 Tax=Podospora fimiseda TaxID=252190 RepID=A0AAN7BE16_9PEZI|nr:hypothetical protein QBC38DRAFT_87458 [Podospora fimiseda]
MRSHPYTPPPPLPFQSPRSSIDRHVELDEIDPDTNPLLQPEPTRKRLEHHVRVQGKLALVKSVSSADLRADITQIPTPPPSAGIISPRIPPRFESAVGSVVAPKETNHQESNTESDKQLRGYGIGGAGNIRRPTDIIHPPTSSDRKWNLREILGLPTGPNTKSKKNAGL